MVIPNAQVSHTSANRLTFKAYYKGIHLVFTENQKMKYASETF